jgi:hypothetical protein
MDLRCATSLAMNAVAASAAGKVLLVVPTVIPAQAGIFVSRRRAVLEQRFPLDRE